MLLPIRPAEPADAAGLARVFVDCWREGYHGILPSAFAARLSYEDQAEAWRRVILMPGNASLVVLSQAGDVIAFLCGGPERSGDSAFFAELYALYVLPEFRGQGLGKRLFADFCGRLTAIGLRSLTARVLEANPLRAFYEELGAVEHDSVPVRVAGRSLNEIVYGWQDISPRCPRKTPGIST